MSIATRHHPRTKHPSIIMDRLSTWLPAAVARPPYLVVVLVEGANDSKIKN